MGTTPCLKFESFLAYKGFLHLQIESINLSRGRERLNYSILDNENVIILYMLVKVLLLFHVCFPHLEGFTT